ncbi:aspartyl protease family protein [Gemmata sp.]|uniref:aspartyl protease family protein n=1 Tax=Gemmata sp. TaxID=1914242 RepID=UPI003F7149E9
MGTDTMGKVIVRAKVENLDDQYMAHKGLLPAEQIRTLEVDDALVDTGATGLMIPTRLLGSLGLRPTRARQAKTVGGFIPMQMYEAVRLTIQGRECVVEVHEIPDHSPVLIGQIPLEALDWVVDPIGQRLIGNPEHGGLHMAEAF